MTFKVIKLYNDYKGHQLDGILEKFDFEYELPNFNDRKKVVEIRNWPQRWQSNKFWDFKTNQNKPFDDQKLIKLKYDVRYDVYEYDFFKKDLLNSELKYGPDKCLKKLNKIDLSNFKCDTKHEFILEQLKRLKKMYSMEKEKIKPYLRLEIDLN